MDSSTAKTRQIERQIKSAIERIARQIISTVPPVVEEPTYEEWLQQLRNRAEQPDIQRVSQHVASRLVNWVNVRSAKSWREAAARSTKSVRIFKLLQQEMAGPVGTRYRELVADTASYIRSVPVEAAEHLVQELSTAALNGARPETQAKMLRRRLPHLVKSRATLISRTQTSKNAAALTEARATSIGLNWYVWQTSEDSRVRSSHALLDNVLCNYSDPPNPDKLAGIRSTLGIGSAGEFPNCRCTQIVVVDVDTLKFPHRVHHAGRIVVMGKQDFLRL